MEKDDFKKQMADQRWLGEDSGAAWELKVQLMVALQKIDMLEEKYEDVRMKMNAKRRG